METKEPLLNSDWTIYRGGAFMLTGTENITIKDCEFDQVGGNAIFVSHYNRRVLIEGCHIHNIGTVERQTAGVQTSMSRNVSVIDTFIYETSRAGINISEGTWGGHLIDRVTCSTQS